MAYKNTVRPLCRTCGKPIRKATATHWIEDGDEAKPPHVVLHSITHHYPGKSLFAKEECQRLTNHMVVSVRKAKFGCFNKLDPNRIRQFTTWDGESYVDEFFCNGDCARRYGYFAAVNCPEPLTQAYVDALKKRRLVRA